ncbi:MAG: hypothetical protein KJ791_03930, partial [Nanoarchaeota archaeon]|nr:hypothetical protein [Nanoarchaeota archaeon]
MPKKTKKKSVKKKKATSKPKVQRTLLTEALRDITKELNRLKKDKSKLQNQISSIETTLVNTQARE